MAFDKGKINKDLISKFKYQMRGLIDSSYNFGIHMAMRQLEELNDMSPQLRQARPERYRDQVKVIQLKIEGTIKEMETNEKRTK